MKLHGIWIAIFLALFILSSANAVPTLTYANGQILRDADGNIHDPWGNIMFRTDGSMNYPRWPGQPELSLRKNENWGIAPWVLYYPEGPAVADKRKLAEKHEVYYPMAPRDQRRHKLWDGWSFNYNDGSSFLSNNWTANPEAITYKTGGAKIWERGNLYSADGRVVPRVDIVESLGLNFNLGFINFEFENTGESHPALKTQMVFDIFRRWSFFMYPIVIESVGLPPGPELFGDYVGYIDTGYWGEVLKYHIQGDKLTSQLVVVNPVPPPPNDWPIPPCATFLSGHADRTRMLSRPGRKVNAQGFVHLKTGRP